MIIYIYYIILFIMQSDVHELSSDNDVIVRNSTTKYKKIANLNDEDGKYNGYGIHGISNLGNTCYMNSVLQSLIASKYFSMYLISDNFIDTLTNNIKIDTYKKMCIKRGIEPFTDEASIIKVPEDKINPIKIKTISYQIARFMRCVWNNKETANIEPSSLKNIIGENIHIFKGCNQHDAHELFTTLLSKIHDDTKTDVIMQFKIKDNQYNNIIKKNQTLVELLKSDINTDIKKNKIDEFNKHLDNHENENVYLKFVSYWSKEMLKDKHSIVTDVFTGIIYEKNVCDECKNKSYVFDKFTSLTLPIPNKNKDNSYDIYDCFNEYSKNEKIDDDDNKYNCEKCNKKVSSMKQSFIWKLPICFAIHLSRFKSVVQKSSNSKIIGVQTSRNNAIIKYPINDLNISTLLSPYTTTENVKYNLYGVIRQSGSLSGGHYTAICKNPYNNNWYLFNDSFVSYIENDKLEKMLYDEAPYILLYEKVLNE